MGSNPYEAPKEAGQPLPIPIPYEEYGGLRWGQSFWNAANATIPFAQLQITDGRLEIRLQAWPFFTDRFEFAPAEVSDLRMERGWISSGVRIVHHKIDYPPFILFWSFRCSRILSAARNAGFSISGSNV